MTPKDRLFLMAVILITGALVAEGAIIFLLILGVISIIASWLSE